MRITISGKNIDVTQGLKDTIYEKLGKLDKYFTPETEAIVTLSVEKLTEIVAAAISSRHLLKWKRRNRKKSELCVLKNLL